MSYASPVGQMAISANTEQMIEATANSDEIRRMSVESAAAHKGIRERVWGLEARVDPTVTYEEFVYWAKVERAMEIEENREYQARRGPQTFLSVLKGRFSKGVHHENEKRKQEEEAEAERLRALQGQEESKNFSGNEKASIEQAPAAETTSNVHHNSMALAPPPATSSAVYDKDAEWRQSSRALRTASWGTIFYLVTTDILGWSSTPYVFASVGFGLGVGVFVIFGIAAAFGGFFIWRVFLGLDSSRFPMLSYGDPFFRIFGSWSRHFINILQALQQFLSVSVIILSSGQIIAQIAKNSFCYVVCFIIVLVIGIASGSIRSLQRIGWFCNASVWLNIINFVIICVAAGIYLPDYSITTHSTLIKTVGPIKTFAGVPPAIYQQQSTNLTSAQLNGVDQMIYAYAGALLFVAFMAEMRHPMDFWKGMLIAQAFICIVYIFFGVFVYAYWGQYSASNIGQVIRPYALQTVGNVLSLLTAFFAVFLYFNIGMKTVYLEVFQEILNFPPIITKRGKFMWFILGPIYWILAFILAASVPNLNTIVSLVGSLLSLNFTYSFPAICYLGFKVQEGAVLPGEGFDPVTGLTTRHDGGIKRWQRGFLKNWYLTVPVLMFGLGGLACSGLGTWASIEGAIQVFGPNGTVATSWGCNAPV